MRARCMLNYNDQFMRTIRRNASSAQVCGLICRQPIHGVANRTDPPNLTLNLVIYYNVARHVRKTSSEAVRPHSFERKLLPLKMELKISSRVDATRNTLPRPCLTCR